MIYDGFSTTENMTADRIADFMDIPSMLIRKNTFVVIDNASVHRCKLMKELRPIREKRALAALGSELNINFAHAT